MFSISWGFRIFLLYTGFAFFIILMVWKSFGEPEELVTDNYYNKELLYNDQMVKTDRVKQLGADLKWRIVDGNLSVEFPGQADGGTLTFLRPSDKNMDVIVTINSDNSDSMLTIAGSSFRKGMYRLKADWTMDGIGYYSEHVVVIP